MAFTKPRQPSEDVVELPTTKTETIEVINESEVGRDIEIELDLQQSISNFPASGTFPAKIRFIHPEALLVAVPPVGETNQSIPDNALESESVKIKALTDGFPASAAVITSSFFDENLGHVLQIGNATELKPRKFMRTLHEVIAKTVIPNERPGREPTEVTFRTIDIGGNGALLTCKKGSGLDVGSFFELHINDRKFPGYGVDLATPVPHLPSGENAAIFEGQIVRVFPNQEKPDNDCFGFEFGFNDTFVEMQMNDQISKYCMDIKLKQHQITVEQERNDRLGGKFKKKVRRF